ncbi:MAG: hypothetical protein QNJ81_06385 [Acidimicrobiia bacterium]|nr:hypothetical protein [Acidimicrobiia bacterium]
MFTVFVFAAVIGWILVAVFLFSAADLDVDFGVDADIDLDADGGLDVSSSGLQMLGAIFSLRSLVFLAAFFGLTGVLLTWLNAGTAAALGFAIAVGVFAAFINVRLMQYLKTTSVSSQLRDSNIEGNAAQVVVPIVAGKRGKVSVDVDGQRLYLVAAPYNERHEHDYSVGDTVVIVEVKNGSALVTPMDQLD